MGLEVDTDNIEDGFEEDMRQPSPAGGGGRNAMDPAATADML